MKGDFSRETFDPQRHFSRVLMQQGRVQLDADWNEQVAIQLHLLRSLAADLIGPHGGPLGAFQVVPAAAPMKNDFVIGAGRYYVDGWLCQNEGHVGFRGAPPSLSPQPYYYAQFDGDPGSVLKAGSKYLVYLDVWERHVSYAETEGPIEAELRAPASLRELALGGPDTTTRAQTIWQVRVRELPNDGASPTNVAEWRKWVQARWNTFEQEWESPRRGFLKAEARTPTGDDRSPCAVPPESRYRGLENQLYRVEVHRGGLASDERLGGALKAGASFKWSRENGAVVFPIADIDGKTIRLDGWGRDGRFALSAGQWVEVIDDLAALHHRANPLRRVIDVDRDTLTVSLDAAPDASIDLSRHALLRRWDHRTRPAPKPEGPSVEPDNAVVVAEEKWIELEDGVRVWFDRWPDPAHPNQYRTGDYWLIPARTAIGDIVWPRQRTTSGGSVPALRSPHGVDHHFAPLAVVGFDTGGVASVLADLRRTIAPLGQPVP